MGLDFSHTDAHWAYGGFMRFRRALAHHEGIELDRMEGFTKDGASWDAVTTPLRDLLAHSDCDGQLTPEQCVVIAPRLREVVSEIWPDPESYDRAHGLLLAEGMEAAAAADEPIEFC